MDKKLLGLVLAGVLCCNVSATQTNTGRHKASVAANKGQNIFGVNPFDLAFKSNNGPINVEFCEAIEKNDTTKAEELLSKGANIDAALDTTQSILFKVAKANNPEMVKWLIDHGAKIDYEEDHLLTPLYFAMEKGAKNAAVVLINRGADVNVRETVSGRTPLYWAAYHNMKDVWDLLVSKGARLDIKDRGGKRPQDYRPEWFTAAAPDNVNMQVAEVRAQLQVLKDSMRAFQDAIGRIDALIAKMPH